jgi:membrane fusion protein (multidrug efflux system)
MAMPPVCSLHTCKNVYIQARCLTRPLGWDGVNIFTEFGMVQIRPLGRVGAAFLIAMVLAACGDDGGAERGAGRPPTRVTSVTVEPRQVSVLEEYGGRAEGVREVQVRARIEGPLQDRLYTEGEYVKEGAPLFRIDPEPFKVAVDRAQARLQSAQATLRQAQREWQRVKRLYDDDAVSTRERDQALSQLELARADVALARAEVADAKIDLGYTEVQAPVSGVTDLEALPEGSLVQPGDLLTTVTQLDPIHVRFALPEDDAYARRHAEQALAGQDLNGEYMAKLILPGGRVYARDGKVDFTDSSVDPDTGTVRARAVFPNPDRAIRPGQFVRVQLRTATLDDAVVVPERAIATGQRGEAVFVIDDEGVAQRRAVTLGPNVKTGRVIERGLPAGERVIVDGLVGVRDGAPVNASPLAGRDGNKADTAEAEGRS